MDKPINFDMERMKRNDPKLFEQVSSMEQVQRLGEKFIWDLVTIGSGGISLCCPIGDKHTAELTVTFKENTAEQATDLESK